MSTFQRVAQWNTLCGKTAPEFGTTEYYAALNNQAQRIQEELLELGEAIYNANNLYGALNCEEEIKFVAGIIKGIEVDLPVTEDEFNKWNQEILDAGCDLDVVVAGANFLAGHAYGHAIEAVLDNNDAKYTPDLKFANESRKALGEGHSVKTVYTEIDANDVSFWEEAGFKVMYNNGVAKVITHSVHRDSDDKICKLINHPKVDLRPFTRTE